MHDCLPLSILQLLLLAVTSVETIGNLLVPLLTETLIRRSWALLLFFTDSTAVILGADGVGNGAACEYELLLKTVATKARAVTPKSEKVLLFIIELFYYNAGCNRALSPSLEPISFSTQKAFHT